MRFGLFLFLFNICLGGPLRAENQVQVLPTGVDETHARNQILEAHEQLDFFVYILKNDSFGFEQLANLRQAVREGKKVRVLIDGFGSDMPLPVLNYLTKTGMEIKVYRPLPFGTYRTWKAWANPWDWSRRAHEKLWIGTSPSGKGKKVPEVILGSRNTGRKFFDKEKGAFEEFGVYVGGEEAGKAAEYFEKIWNSPEVLAVEKIGQSTPAEIMAAKKILDKVDKKRSYEIAKAAKKARYLIENATPVKKVEFVFNNPEAHISTMDKVLSLIREAQKEVYIANPYFILTNKMLKAFREKLHQGATVKAVINSPSSTTKQTIRAAHAIMAPFYRNAGMQIFESKRDSEIHKKLIAIDGEKSFVGSANFDPRSQSLNNEVGFIIEDAKITKKIRESIAAEISFSRRQRTHSDILSSCGTALQKLLLYPIWGEL